MDYNFIFLPGVLLLIYLTSRGKCSGLPNNVQENMNEGGNFECSFPNKLKEACVQEPPSKLQIIQLTSDFASLKWTAPATWNMSERGYLICHTKDGILQRPDIVVGENSTASRKSFLQPWTSYEFMVKAFSNDTSDEHCTSPPITTDFMTDMRAPSNPESVVVVPNVTAREITVQWMKPLNLNGPLSGYYLSLTSNETTENRSETISDQDYVFKGLTPWTHYNIDISAFNKKDDGQVLAGPAVTASNRTTVSKPGPVTEMRFSNQTSTSVFIEWDEPEERNGPISGYFFSIYKTGDPACEAKRTSCRHYNASSLVAFTNYTVTVDAFNLDEEGRQLMGDNTTVTGLTDPAGPSAPLDLEVESVTNSSFTIKWKEPEFKNGPLSGYTISYAWDYINYTVLDTNATEQVIQGLSPWTNYTVLVSAYNLVEGQRLSGDGVRKVVTTDSAAPSSPVSLTIVNVSSTNVSISWSAPKDPNGPITGYDATCQSEQQHREQKETSETTLTFSDLKPWTKYTISVSAFNNGSDKYTGPQANVSSFTLAAAPSAPVSLTVLNVTNSSSELQWKRPETPNGPIRGYLVRVEDRPANFTPGEEYALHNLKPWTTYTISVAAFNLDWENGTLEGEGASVHFKTAETAPPFPKNITSAVAQDTTIQFDVPAELFSNENGPISEYVMLVAAGDGMDTSPGEGYEGIINTPFQNWKNASGTSNVYRSSPPDWSPQQAITEVNTICQKKNATAYTCTVGNAKSCADDEFCDAPLVRHTKYRIKLRGYTKKGWSETFPLEATTGGCGDRLSNLLVVFGVMAIPAILRVH